MASGDDRKSELEALAGGRRRSLVVELWSYVKTRGKWWLAPLLVTMLVLGLFVVLASAGAGPLIYALF